VLCSSTLSTTSISGDGPAKMLIFSASTQNWPFGCSCLANRSPQRPMSITCRKWEGWIPSIAGKFLIKDTIDGDSTLSMSSASFVYPLLVAANSGPVQESTVIFHSACQPRGKLNSNVPWPITPQTEFPFPFPFLDCK
jgi:hypothetical protein